MQPFWPKAIAAVRHRARRLQFMAEVYWDLEWTLQQQGFDHCYDKRLYDRLRALQARPVREHLQAGLDYQDRLARFLENHDEPRAAATFAPEVHAAAAVITFCTPGLRFFHQGQLEGRRVHISPHLVRAPEEPVDARPGGLLCAAARRAAPPGAARRRVVAARLRRGLGRQPECRSSSSPGAGRCRASPGCAWR